jgi:hypothetical protein
MTPRRSSSRRRNEDRMRLERQMQMPIILDHLLAGRHRRQMRVGFELVHARAGKERKIVLVAGAPQCADRPRRLAPVEAERAERVRRGEALQHGRLQARAQPEIADGIEALAAHRLDALAVIFRKSADLAEAETQRAFGAHGLFHAGMARM